MNESDLRRSPSLERLIQRRPSFSRPPIRTIHSPRLTEDEAEMLTSPFLQYRTKYTYAKSSCYNPDLPCSWEVPNLANAQVEINSPYSYIHVAAPSLLYIIYSYILWILEVIVYFGKKLVVTLLKDGPVSLLVLLYDLVCYIFYGCKSLVVGLANSLQNIFLGNALHQDRSATHVLQKAGYFFLSLLLLPVSAAHWLFEKSKSGARTAKDSVMEFTRKTPANVHPYRRRASMEHVRFNPDVTTSSIDDQEYNPPPTTTKRRSERPIHNLRNRMITQIMTDSEDEGFSEKRPTQAEETPTRSVLKTRRKINYAEDVQPQSKAVRIAHFLGSTASSIVSSIYWIIIEVLMIANRGVDFYKQKVGSLFRSRANEADVPIMQIRRSTRKMAESVQLVEEIPEETKSHWAKRAGSVLLYPLIQLHNFGSWLLYGFIKIFLATAFAMVDAFRYVRNKFIAGLVYLYTSARHGFYQGRNEEEYLVSGEVLDETESIQKTPIEALKDGAATLIWMSYSFLNWSGERMVDGYRALGDKKRLILWLLPLLLLLFILLSRKDNHYPQGLEPGAKEIKARSMEKAYDPWALFDPEGIYMNKAAHYYSSAKDATVQMKDNMISFVYRGTEGVVDFFSHGHKSLWQKTSDLFLTLWRTLTDGATRIYHFFFNFFNTVGKTVRIFFVNTWKAVSGGPKAIWTGLTDLFSYLKRLFTQTALYLWYGISNGAVAIKDVASRIVRAVWFGLNEGVILVRNFLVGTAKMLWHGMCEGFILVKDFFVGGGRAIWNGVVFILQTIWNAVKYIFQLIYNFIMAIWNRFVDFLVYLIDIWRAVSKKARSYIPEKMSVPLPSTDSIKKTVYEYYQAVPTVVDKIPTLTKMPELPELPLPLYPSYYKEYVPSQEKVSNTFWNILGLPRAMWSYMKGNDSSRGSDYEFNPEEDAVEVKPVDLGSVPSPQINPAEEFVHHRETIEVPPVDLTPQAPQPTAAPTVQIIEKHIHHPAPKIEIPKIDEAKIIQEVLARLSLPKVDEEKVIREVAAKLNVPKVDEDRIIKEVTKKVESEMELKIKALELSYKKNIEEINVKHTNVEVDYSHLEALIRKAIYQYDADKTGLFDFALESAGAAVISTRCSENYNSYSRLEKIWNIPLWYSSYGPRTVIQRNSNSLFPGECWSFKSGRGYLTIDLSHRINISSISYEHISADQAPDNNRSSAPKTFKFWAYKSEDDIQGRFLLGSFEYKLDGHPLQFFVIKDQPDFPVKIVEMEVTSNYGAEFTCLYRLRVHGQIYKA